MMNFYERMDCVIVWGHAIENVDEILKMIRGTESLKILHIEKIHTNSIKKIVHSIYSFDYAPLIHLRSKIKYLEKTKPVVYFIFVQNSKPNEDYFGESRFRHIESKLIRELKQKIRERFNPKDARGNITQDHVVHATDNESQTDSILKLLGYKTGSASFRGIKKIIPSPYYIGESDKFSIRRIPYENLYCGNVVTEKCKTLIKIMPVKDSIQYKSLSDSKLYDEYISQYLGTFLKQDYNLIRYNTLANNYKYIDGSNAGEFIIVNPYDNGKYVIIDGLHRAALHLYAGNDHIIGCIYE